VLLCHWTDEIQGVKVQVVPIAAVMESALHPARVEPGTLSKVLGIAVIAVCQEASDKGLKQYKERP
jgi:hypothetical protein